MTISAAVQSLDLRRELQRALADVDGEDFVPDTAHIPGEPARTGE